MFPALEPQPTYVRACVRACVFARVHVRVRVRACVRASLPELGRSNLSESLELMRRQ